MGNFLVKEPPEFSQELKTLEPTDRAHADVFNALFGQLINNDAFLAALTRKTAEAVKEFLTSKGEPEGIASLDEEGKVPKEQIKLAAGDVGALPLFENKITLREAGWYRICQPKLGNATSFSIRFIKDWWHREGGVLALNISATEYKTGNVGHYNVHINQLISQGNGILDKVRVVASNEMNPAYIDMHYTLNEENNFYIQVDSVISNGDKAFCIELLEKEPQILETQSIHEWNYTRGGLVADSAKKDGNGNDIAETYFTNTQGNELKKSVSDGKTLVANTITAKGVPTAADAAFDTIATNISQITTGVDTSDANAGAADILAGKTAYVNGSKIIGNIPKAPSHPNEYTASDFHLYGNTMSGNDHNIFMLVPKGYYNETWVGYKDPNLIPENIKKGVQIGKGLKITGTYEQDTSATATSYNIDYGKTAWVNGIKIEGTAKYYNQSTFVYTSSSPNSNIPSSVVAYNKIKNKTISDTIHPEQTFGIGMERLRFYALDANGTSFGVPYYAVFIYACFNGYTYIYTSNAYKYDTVYNGSILTTVASQSDISAFKAVVYREYIRISNTTKPLLYKFIIPNATQTKCIVETEWSPLRTTY